VLFSVGIWESFLHLPGTLGLGWSTRKHRVAAVENRTPLKSGDLVSKPGLAMKSILLFSQSQASTRCQHMFAPFWVFECELCKTIVYEYSMLKYMELLCGWIIISAGSLPLGSAGGRAAGRTTSWEKCDEHIAKQLLCVVPPRYLSWLIRVQYCGFLGDIISIVFMGLSIYNWGGGTPSKLRGVSMDTDAGITSQPLMTAGKKQPPCLSSVIFEIQTKSKYSTPCVIY
jgi:hypothetical protein